jgi:hypothetical protein
VTVQGVRSMSTCPAARPAVQLYNVSSFCCPAVLQVQRPP